MYEQRQADQVAFTCIWREPGRKSRLHRPKDSTSLEAAKTVAFNTAVTYGPAAVTETLTLATWFGGDVKEYGKYKAAEVAVAKIAGPLGAQLSRLIKTKTKACGDAQPIEKQQLVNLPSGIIKGTGGAKGALQTFWPPNRGFLGTPKTETLQPGTMIDRYGYPKGTFVSPEGTPFEMRALPAEKNANMPYHKYEVVACDYFYNELKKMIKYM